MKDEYDLIVITGPTASGKTRLAAVLAREINAEIVSADSRQIYRGMDLGTGKDLSDYIVDNELVPFHLIDIANPGEKYSVFEYQRDCLKCISEIQSRNNKVILCGGTGMYIDAVINSYRMPQVPVNEDRRAQLELLDDDMLIRHLSSLKPLHNQSDTDSRKRMIRAIEIAEYQQQHAHIYSQPPQMKSIIFGISVDREIRRHRITGRLYRRLDDGMLDEVQHLLDSGIPADSLIYYGLEYKYLTQHLIGELSHHEMIKQLNTAIHQFAKRQMTWFRKMEKEGNTIHWIDENLTIDEKLGYIRNFL